MSKTPHDTHNTCNIGNIYVTYVSCVVYVFDESPSTQTLLMYSYAIATGCMPENNCQESWHKVVKAAIHMYLRGSTVRCLEKAIPHLSSIDALRMGATLKPMELQCVTTKTLQKALVLTEKGLRMIFSDTNNEYFVLRISTGHRFFTKTMINDYRKLMNKQEPKSTDPSLKKRWENVMRIAKTLRRVTVAEATTIPVSTMYNPMHLQCFCWAGRHNGICSHVIGVNAFHKKINLKQLLAPIDEPKKKGRKKRMHYLMK